MRAVLQRVTEASVTVDGELIAAIGPGLLALVGASEGDTEATASRLAKKTAELRIFSDAEGRFNRSLLDCQGEALVVSQFTLLADSRHGRRPSFTRAAAPELAEPLIRLFGDELRNLGIATQSGRFGAHMQVRLENDGPVTILLDSEPMG